MSPATQMSPGAQSSSGKSPRAKKASRHRYAELHAHSAYSFLDGVNEPEDLVAAAAALGLEALALTDHDGMPGIVRHAQGGRTCGLPTIYGSELTLADSSRLPILARDPGGYRGIVSAISRHNLEAAERRDPAHRLDALSREIATHGSCLVLTGTARGPLRRALGPRHEPSVWDEGAASRCLGELVELFGRDQVAVELCLDGAPSDALLTAHLQRLAAQYRLPLVATGAVRCARPSDHHLADVMAATRHACSLEEVRPYLPAAGRHLRSAAEMAYLHRRYPQAVDEAAALAEDLAFDLALVAPDLPEPQVGQGHTAASWLRELVYEGAQERYGSPEEDPHAWKVIEHELSVIEGLGFSGYFLIVREIVDFCRQSGILCQGRGSAANSAVCYALGITAVDAVRHEMLFERFLSSGRSGYPDIDLDIEACRREEVIQHVYARYGRHYAAQVATVISYRPRSALRDAARALGYPSGLQDVWARGVERGWSRGRRPESQTWADEPQAPTHLHHEGNDSGNQPGGNAAAASAPGGSVPDGSVPPEEQIPAQVEELAEQLLLLPRHLGIHSGGMVLTSQPLTQVCPVRWGAMPGRSVVQWDKDDCAAAGLVKFDLLGLGMLTALRLAFTSLEARGERVPEGTHGVQRSATIGKPWGLHTLPEEDPGVYRLLQAADTIGVFQVESRAQMATLPRLAPACFYDIVVEVALIRPGPIQGDAVNPYLRRRLGREEVTYLHPSLKPALEKTLGVPLFQEQLMQIAIDAAGFTPTQADALRQAMGAKRSHARMDALHDRLVAGMGERGIPAATAEEIFHKLRAFADFGFPESHAFSFAYLVYASAWLKVRRPEDFYAGILAAQPMGFWSPHTIVADARRHGVRILPACINHSQEEASVESIEPDPALSRPAPSAASPLDLHPHLGVRLGLARIAGLGKELAHTIVAQRRANGPYRDAADLARRVRLTRNQIEALAASGALESLGTSRRQGLWAAAALAGEYGHRGGQGVQPHAHAPARAQAQKQAQCEGGSDEEVWASQGSNGASQAWFQPPLPGTMVGAKAPELGEMSLQERHEADLSLTGVAIDTHAMGFLRAALSEHGVVPIAQIPACGHGCRIVTAGTVTHRQRPHTAAGTVFLNIEDETGMLNVICPRDMWRRYRSIGKRARALVVRGRVEQADGVTALIAEHLETLQVGGSAKSRDWA